MFYYDPLFSSLTKCTELAAKHGVPTELKDELERALSLFISREEYANRMSSPCSQHLSNIQEQTNAHPWDSVDTVINVKPRMVAGHLEGNLLKTIVSLSNAKNALDIGTFTGYSALAMAEELPPDGTVVTCEFDPYIAKLARGFLDKSSAGRKVKIRQGAALDTLKALVVEGMKFDVAFVDADMGMIDYYDIMMKHGLLSENGTLVFDNTLYYGTTYDSSCEGMENGQAMADFNNYVKNDKSVHSFIIPVRDGVTIIRRKTNMGDVINDVK